MGGARATFGAMAVLLRTLALLLIGYGGLCLLLYVFQARLVFFPGPPPAVDAAALGFEEVRLATEDGVELHGWFLPAAGARGAVLVCHGNAGSIEQRVPVARAFHGLGWAVLLFDYRGYGASAGRPSEQGTYGDAEAAYRNLVEARGFTPERIALYGESLGAAVAVELAREHPVAALVAESAFTSLPDIGAEAYPFFPVRWLARYRYDNLAKVGRLEVPLLLVHSPQDEIVPVQHSRRLLPAAREPKRLLLTEGGHNDGGFLRRAEWVAEVGEFLEEALAARSIPR
jgi:hypothetical protein